MTPTGNAKSQLVKFLNDLVESSPSLSDAAWRTHVTSIRGRLVSANLKQMLSSFDDLVAQRPDVAGKSSSSAVLAMRRGQRLREIVEVLVAELAVPTESEMMAAEPAGFDVAIVCALHEPELSALRNASGTDWRKFTSPRDPTTYWETELSSGATALRLVAAAPTEMGMSASGVLASKMILRFQPKLVAMCGIAAGAKKGHQSFGDILAAEHTWDYGAGKITERGFEGDPKPIGMDARVLDRLKIWERRADQLDEIRRGWRGRKPASLKMHVGPIGSGAAVVASAKPIKSIKQFWRKLVGIEMEAHAVNVACRYSANPPIPFICMKSICDFASGKNDDWQEYAAYTSASSLVRFISEEWGSLSLVSIAESN